MKGFLLDTDVVSLLARPLRDEAGKFADWLEQRDREGRVFPSAAAIHEIRKGIELLEHTGATTKAPALHSRQAGLRAGYADRALELDASMAETSGNAEARALTAGHGPGMADALVAGVADFHDLVVIASGIKHLRALGALPRPRKRLWNGKNVRRHDPREARKARFNAEIDRSGIRCLTERRISGHKHARPGSTRHGTISIAGSRWPDRKSGRPGASEDVHSSDVAGLRGRTRDELRLDDLLSHACKSQSERLDRRGVLWHGLPEPFQLRLTST